MDRNEDAFDRDDDRNEADIPTNSGGSKKTLDEFLDKMDAWDKIAAQLETFGATAFDSVAEGVAEPRRPSTAPSEPARDSVSHGRVASDDAICSAADSSSSDRPAKPSSFSISYDDVDKLGEDYETRSKYRERSVWNNGEWGRERPLSERKSVYRNEGDRERDFESRRSDGRCDSEGWRERRTDGDPRGERRNGARSFYGRGGESDRRRRRTFEGDGAASTPFERRRERGGENERFASLEPTTYARGKRGEPLSLAEEHAARQKARAAAKRRGAAEGDSLDGDGAENRDFESIESIKSEASEASLQTIVELEQMPFRELVAAAREQNLETIDGESRRELVLRVLRARLRRSGLMYGEGTLEILPGEFGFLRNAAEDYLSCPDDIYISPSQIRRFGLRDGLTVFGQIRPPKERERYFALLRVEAINGEDPNALALKPFLDQTVAESPTRRVRFETSPDDIDARIFDLCAPFALGQRGLFLAPPHSGKSTHLVNVIKALLKNKRDMRVLFEMIDQRPEEIVKMKETFRDEPRCEIVGTRFDEPIFRHSQVDQIVYQKALRLAEYGRDVLLIVDSLTSLVRAWDVETTGRFGNGDTPLELDLLTTAKKRFAMARSVAGGGSLSLIATIDGDPNDRIAQDLFFGLKAYANVAVFFEPELVRRKVWPPINLFKTGSLHEELIYGPEEMRLIAKARDQIVGKTPVDATRWLRKELEKTKSNEEFLARFQSEDFDDDK